MNEPRPPVPPPGKPIRDFKTPNISDGYYFQRISKNTGLYAPLKRGTPYATIKNAEQKVINQFPNLYFLREIASEKNDDVAIRIWATDPLAENSYNSQITYLAESITNPVFARIYNVRREIYEAAPTVAPGTALQTITFIKITNKGTAPYKTPIVSIAGSGGATAEAVLDQGGFISAIVLTNQGGGYANASPPAVTIADSAGGTGAGATATASMQTASAVLTSQQKRELSTEDPLHDEYVQVMQVYTTLPGPWIYEITRDAETLGEIIVKRRQNLISNITTGTALSGSTPVIQTITSRQDIDSNIAWEIVTTRTFPGDNAKIVSYKEKAFQFPGRINAAGLEVYGEAGGYRRTFAELITLKLETWWVKQSSAPTPADVGVEDIITDTVVAAVNTQTDSGTVLVPRTYQNVLHDLMAQPIPGGGVLDIGPSSPSYSEYVGINPGAIQMDVTSGNASATLVSGSVAPGDKILIYGLLVGGVVLSVVGSAVTFVSNWAGASQSPGTFNVLTPGGGWVGNYKPADADILPADVPGMFKVTTVSPVWR